MIKREELKEIKNFDVDLLNEAVRQAELRISDENSRKERIDTRAYNMIFLNVAALIIVSVIIVVGKIGSGLNTIFMGLSGVIFLIAMCFLIRILRPAPYGELGVPPNIWLQRELLKEGCNRKGYVLAHILYDYEERILASDSSNGIRSELLEKAIFATFCAYAVLSSIPFISISIIELILT